MNRYTKSMILGALLLSASAWAQTITVPLTGSTTLPDGTKATVTGSATVTVVPPPPVPVALYGPRDAVGPDVPLTAAETGALATRVTVAGFTAAAIQTACDKAKAQGVATVYLPAGTYTLLTFVNVPGGLTILGAGSATLLKPATAFVEMFFTRGDSVRYTRLKLVGPATGVWLQGDTQCTARGIEAWGNQNVRVDHCEISGMAYATLYMQNATGQVDHCFLHHNQVIGYGYGASMAAGARVTVTDNSFSDNRHSLASNGGGTRPTAWEFSYNKVTNLNPSSWQQAQIDTHAGFDGTFALTGNDFSKLDTAIGLYAGSGTVTGNRIADSDQGIKVYNSTVHDLAISRQVFAGLVRAPYVIAVGALGITVDGVPYRPPAQGAGTRGQKKPKRLPKP